MKVKDLANKMGRRTDCFIDIKRGNDLLIRMFSDSFCDKLLTSEFLDMTVNFFNIDITEKGNVFFTIQV